MPGPYVLDASVFLNAFNSHEAGYAESHEFLTRLQAEGTPIVAPTLLLPETAAAISRGRGDTVLAQRFALALSRLPHLVLVPLDRLLAKQAVDVASQYKLRGSDAVYAATAIRFNCSLVTLDREQHDRVAAVLAARYPREALAEIQL